MPSAEFYHRLRNKIFTITFNVLEPQFLQQFPIPCFLNLTLGRFISNLAWWIGVCWNKQFIWARHFLRRVTVHFSWQPCILPFSLKQQINVWGAFLQFRLLYLAFIWGPAFNRENTLYFCYPFAFASIPFKTWAKDTVVIFWNHPTSIPVVCHVPSYIDLKSPWC